MKAALKQIPEDTTGDGDLVHKQEVKKELREIRDKTHLLEQLGEYKSTDDLLRDFSLEAAKRTVIEMEFGKTSADRLKAAESVLNRSIGKPIERIANINMDITEMADEEIDATIGDLLNELGYKKKDRKLIETAEGSAPKEVTSEESSPGPK